MPKCWRVSSFYSSGYSVRMHSKMNLRFMRRVTIFSYDDTPYEVAPPTPGTNVTKDPVHSWAGTPQRTKPNTGTPSGDDKISGNHADHTPPTHSGVKMTRRASY